MIRLFDGDWLVYRKLPRGVSRKVGGNRLPSFRHKSYESAVIEAQRLLGLFPESSFIILREVAVVKGGEK